MQPEHDDDVKLTRAFDGLALAPHRQAQLESLIVERSLARRPSLAREWLDVLRARPVVHGAYFVAATAALWLATPVGPLVHLLQSLAK